MQWVVRLLLLLLLLLLLFARGADDLVDSLVEIFLGQHLVMPAAKEAHRRRRFDLVSRGRKTHAC